MVFLPRGVNRRVIEVKNTNNDYFEKAILFVRDEMSKKTDSQLKIMSLDFFDSLSLDKKMSKKLSHMKIVIAFLGVLSVSLLIALIYFI